MSFRQALRETLIVAFKIPWKMFPLALRGMFYCLAGCVVGTVFTATAFFAQTPYKELQEAHKDNDSSHLLLYLLGACFTAIGILFRRIVKLEDISRKDLLSLFERSITAQQQHTAELVQLKHTVQELQRLVLANHARN